MQQTFNRSLVVTIVIAVTLLLLPGSAVGTDWLPTRAAEVEALSDVDVRAATPEIRQPRGAQLTGLQALEERGVTARWDAARGAPAMLISYGATLSGPSGGSPEAVALRFLREHAAVYGLTSLDLANVEIVSSYPTAHNGAHHVVLGQRIGGRRVFGSSLSLTIDDEGRVVIASGSLARGPALGTARLGAEEALRTAGAAVGAEVDEPLRPTHDPRPYDRAATFDNVFAEDLLDPADARAELVWFAVPGEAANRPAWWTEVEVDETGWYETLVDAETGEVLYRSNYYAAAGPEGTVFTGQHPDDSPARQVVPFSGIDGSWVTDRVTSGNNVNAFRNLDGATEGYQPETPESGEAGYQHFNYAFTDAWRQNADGTDASLDADLDAVVTQLLYYTNVLHDYLYDLGFDEPAGNFQVDNFGRGGADGDPVRAHAQFGWDFGCEDDEDPPNAIRCRNNAFFATPADGASPNMRMYMWAPPGRPYRDGSLDGDVVAHEYGHGLSNRLIGGPSQGMGSAGNPQTGALGEGWSDAVSLLLWGDTMVGEYVTGNFNRGIRSSSYDTNTDVYSDFDPARGVHRNGELWAAIMYDTSQLLGIPETEQLMVDGLKNLDVGPTYLDARDGFLAADQTNNGGANLCPLWGVFAPREVGFSATSSADQITVTGATDFDPQCVPVADVGGPYSTDEGAAITLDATASEESTHVSGGALSFAWDLTGNGQFDDATGPTPEFLVGDDGTYPVAVRVTNEAGASDEASTVVEVANVAPTVAIDPAQVTATDEGDTVTVTATYSDPGWLDTHTAEIDWGTPAGDVMAGTVAVTDTGDPGPVEGTVEGSFTYGDRGVFTITVTVTDKDGDSGSAQFDLDVANVDPTVAIDKTDAELFGGTETFLGQINVPMPFSGNATDPGSDDLTFLWDWDDGTTDLATYLVNPPLADPFPSPTVQPRDVTDDQEHTWTQGCLYTVVLTVTDDDGGSGDDDVQVVIVGDADANRSAGYWHNQYRPTGGGKFFTTEELDCYLAIVDHLSEVFHGVRDASTRELATQVLRTAGSSAATDILDRQLLAAWLNVANGAIGFDDLVDTTGDGVADTTFGEAVTTAESVRLDAAASREALLEQAAIMERINLRDE